MFVQLPTGTYVVTLPLVWLQSIVMSISVCLPVFSSRMSQRPHVQTLKNFQYMLTVTVALCSSNDTISYVLKLFG